MFGFTYWGLTSGGPLSEAGAFMNFSMKLASDPSQKAALEKFMRSGRQIAVLPVMSSTVGLTTTKKDSAPLERLIEEMNFPQHGGRAEDEVGVNVVFTGVGAKVFKAAIDTPGVFKVDYCYKILGLGPNFSASIEVEMQRTYEYFQAAASVGWGFFSRAQIEAAVENLRTQKSITIHSDGGNATDREYLSAVADQIIQRVFKPELDMKPVDGGNGNGGWSFSRYSLNSTNKNELSKETWQFRRRDLVQRQFCVPMSLKEIRDHKDQVIRNADL